MPLPDLKITDQSHVFVDVAVALPLPSLYTYAVPGAMVPEIHIGKRVKVPFGRRRIIGYIMACRTEQPDYPTKDILAVLDGHPLFPESMIPFFHWIAEYYVCPIGQVIESALPSGLTHNTVKPKQERYVSLLNDRLPANPTAVTRQKVIDVLRKNGNMTVTRLKTFVPTAGPVLKPLADAGHVRISRQTVYRDPFGDPITPDAPLALTPEQVQAKTKIAHDLGKGFVTYLLAGVTGSGKTEVYMHLARQALDKGLQVLVLVPEIALISQVERRFRARFGEQVAILHSGLNKGEKYDQWLRIIEEKAPVVIGTRSAVFAPLTRIGLIVVDEEHDTSYKQDATLMYNGRDLAVIRANLEKCVAVLGSATPSVQSYYNVNVGKYKMVALTRRVQERPLSDIQIVDLRDHKGIRGIRQYITPPLIQAVQSVLHRKEQALLFINRRGFANLSVCGACGQPVKCRNCDVTLTLHQHINAHQCHYCGFSQASVHACPVCGSSFIQHLGMGTEKIEAAVASLFPDARIARMDRDTTRKKGTLLSILKKLKNREIDILIGTQMVAKGHDFPNITLVGIICADLSLSFPDFRSGSRTFQLLAQVAGRAGRGASPGRVILQTYNPAHFCISAARTQDFKVFYEQDIAFRKALKYPPFSRMVMLKISGKSADTAKAHATLVGRTLNQILAKQPEFAAVAIRGPVASAIHKLANRYRWQIILKGPDARMLHTLIHHLQQHHKPLFSHPQVKMAVDVDPIFMM